MIAPLPRRTGPRPGALGYARAHTRDIAERAPVPSERLGAQDLEGNIRVADGVVDQAACETGAKPPRP